MTHDQAQSIAVQAMHQISERFRILDMYADPTKSELEEFVAAIRAKSEAFDAAWERYMEATSGPRID